MASSKYSLLNNRYVLYFFLFLAIVDIMYFINSGDMKSLMVFVLITVLTSMFNKNMIVILCLSLVTTHLIKFGSKSYQEGMNNKAVKEGTMNKKDVKEGAKSKLGMSDVDEENKVVDNDEFAEVDDEKADKKMDKKADKMDKKKLQKKITQEIKKITPLITKYLGKEVPDEDE